MLLRRLSLLVALLAAATASAQVYKWVDEDGVVHYSDQPVPGAEEVRVETRSERRAPNRATQPAQGSTQPAASTAPGAPPAAPFSYQSLSISSPAAEATLWNIGGVLNVALNLSPGLRNGDRVRLYFDGEPRMISGLRTELTEVWRGEHNLQAEVIDANGELMIRSQPIRFYVQQSSILN